MGVQLIFRCLALIYFSFNHTNSLTVTKKSQEPLKSDKPEEFVKSTEKAVKDVNYVREITDKMNNYLASHPVEANLFCEGKLETCKSIIERYVNRCKSGDCYSLDPVTVFSAPGKFEITLPHLGQYEMAKYVFDKSGARNSGWSRFADFFKKEKSKNSLAEFNNELLRRNLTRVTTDVNNYMLLNEVLYAATIYYQKYLNENRFSSARSNSSRGFRTFFKLKHRSPLVKMVRDMVGDQTIGVSHSDLKSLMDSVALYLSIGNYRPRMNVTVAYARMVKHAIAVALGYKKISFLMAEYLLTHPTDPGKYCKGNAEVTCKQTVTGYLERCDEGDCTTLDTVDLLDPKDWLNTRVPVLSEVAVSFDLFNGSKARQPNWFKRWLFFNRGRMTPEQFKETLYNRNVANATYKTKNQGILHRFLFKGALEFVWRAKKLSIRHGLTDSTNTMMKFMSSVAGRDRVYLEIPKVRNVFLQYRNYLYKSGLSVSLSKVNKFTKDNQLVLFSYLHDPHGGEYNDRYSEEWQKLKEKELKEAEKELASEEAKEEKEEVPEGEEEEEKKHIGNLWGLIKTKKAPKKKVDEKEGKEGKEGQEKEETDDLKKAKNELDTKINRALEDFKDALGASETG
ncbi:hypothetical protein MACK_000593 [Theileria orientalis]|uniref:Rhoptry-associated protein 1 n=1 Tax=Theileria orientalis TaxID=68886 RepID=A0A976M9V3_THEOR|nr:hypothetical protein MACK_000593 [Theileria orientalis]